MWSRRKNWDTFALITEEFSLLVGLAEFGYISRAFILVYQKEKVEEDSKIISFWDPVSLSDSPDRGLTSYNSSDFSIYFGNRQDGSKHIVLRQKDNTDINLLISKQTDLVASFIPLNSDSSQYQLTGKRYNLETNGVAKLFGYEYKVKSTYAFMEWSRGVWPYYTHWLRGVGQGKQGHLNVGLSIGDRYNLRAPIEASDDFLVINHNLIKLGTVKANNWNFQTVNRSPHSDYAMADITFVPSESTRLTLGFGVVDSDLQYIFGRFVGTVWTTATEYKIDVNGYVEVHEARW